MHLPRYIFQRCLGIFFLMVAARGFGQNAFNVFKKFETEEPDSFRLMKPLRFYEILSSKTGLHKFSTNYGLIRDKGMDIEIILYTGPDYRTKKLMRNYIGEDSIRSMCEGAGKEVFLVSHDNKILWQPSDDGGVGYTPFNFPPEYKPDLKVSKIWIDAENNLYIGTYQGGLYFIRHGGNIPPFEGQLDSTGNFVVTKGKIPVDEFAFPPNTSIYSFEQDQVDKNRIWIGTSNGLMFFNKITKETKKVFDNNKNNDRLTVTDIKADSSGDVWFSTLQHGMGVYTKSVSAVKFFDSKGRYSIQRFCHKSPTELFVAVTDSVPAIFNTVTGDYSFLRDSIFRKTADSTSDIVLDGLGNLFVIKGGGLYYTDYFKESKPFANTPVENKAYSPFIEEIILMGQSYREEGNLRNLKSIHLKYFQNSLTISFSIAGYVGRENVQFAWMAEGYLNEWVELPVSGTAQIPAILNNLAPGQYVFKVKARVGNEKWRTQQAQLEIIISPPSWQTWWFWLSAITGISLLVFIIVKWRVNAVRKQERVKAIHEKEMLELEAKALRAQMNPHFIFNCLNSIKSLIQQKEEDKAIGYLTTFSKLIRTIFQNSDKREVTLYDEIETCKLYTQLESMRFGNRFNYHFNIDETVDLKSVQVPALIIQPFIENAIWHGIMPKPEGGTLSISISKKEDAVCCVIEDDGIGREMSKQNKFKGEPSTHQSKGVHLTQSRLDLDNALNQRNGSVEIIDMKDDAGDAVGTKIILTFKEY